VRFFPSIFSITAAALFQAGAAFAQEPSPKAQTEIQLLQKQMLEMQTGMQQMQAQHQQEIAALKTQVESQQKVIDEFQKSVASTAPPMPAGPNDKPPAERGALFPTTDASVVAAAPPPGGSSPPTAFPTTDASVTTAEPPPASATGFSLTAPITLVGGGKTYMNISFDGQFAAAFSTERELDRLEVGDHDPQQRGFNARNVELALDGAVDPYFQGFANIVFKLDNENETSVEAEEAFMQTTALPWGLQLKGGQFFAAFGRINPQHPHVWDFADAPLVNGRLLGPDGLRGVGAQISWVMPFTWYSQFIFGVQNGNGGTGFSFRNPGEDGEFFGRTTLDRKLRGVQDFVFIPRWESSFDLSPTQTLLLGVSGAFGPNDTGASTRTQIYGADVFYKWKSPHAEGGFPFVKWQTEALLRRFEAGRGADDAFPVSEIFTDWGAYSQLVWGFEKGWTAGLRGDYLHFEDSRVTDDSERQSRWRASANLTWYPTEFSKLRLQYNHDFLEANEFLDRHDVDSLFLQFEFALGSHAAHKF
jgi:hypothetical protein